MTMLTHTHGPFEPAPRSTERRNTTEAGTAAAHLAMIKRFCIGALAVVAAGSALAVIVALKAAIYYWRFF